MSIGGGGVRGRCGLAGSESNPFAKPLAGVGAPNSGVVRGGYKRNSPSSTEF